MVDKKELIELHKEEAKGNNFYLRTFVNGYIVATRGEDLNADTRDYYDVCCNCCECKFCKGEVVEDIVYKTVLSHAFKSPKYSGKPCSEGFDWYTSKVLKRVKPYCTATKEAIQQHADLCEKASKMRTHIPGEGKIRHWMSLGTGGISIGTKEISEVDE